MPSAEQAEPLRLGEARRLGRTVRAATLARAEAAHQGLAVRRTAPPASGGPSRRPAGCRSAARSALPGKRSRVVRGGRRHVRAVAAVQGALGLVGGDQLVQQPHQALGVALAGHRGDDVALGVDHREGGPGLGGVLLPHLHVGVVEDGVVDAVPLDGGGEGGRVPLVLELRRVHADDDEGVAVFLLQRPQLVQDVQTVDAAEGPKVEHHDLAAQVGKRRLPPVFSQDRPRSSGARTRGLMLTSCPSESRRPAPGGGKAPSILDRDDEDHRS